MLPEWASSTSNGGASIPRATASGATGGKGGEGLASDYFMMRIGIPNGILTASQLRAIGDLAQKYARNLADITVRQSIQLHWLTIESLPEVVDALDAIGLSPKGACGDVVRNVTGCPLAGVAADELIDASPLAAEISRTAQRQIRSSTTCRASSRSASPAAPRGAPIRRSTTSPSPPSDIDGQIGYSLRVGGGLSNEPHLAVRLNAFVLPEQAVRVARAVSGDLPRAAGAAREPRRRRA